MNYDGLDFHTRALQHSNVLLSWDDDEPHRVKKLRRKYTEEQVRKKFLYASNITHVSYDNFGSNCCAICSI